MAAIDERFLSIFVFLKISKFVHSMFIKSGHLNKVRKHFDYLTWHAADVE